jgi:hypothetical protein
MSDPTHLPVQAADLPPVKLEATAAAADTDKQKKKKKRRTTLLEVPGWWLDTYLAG